MNLAFLVEGKTELRLYPRWVNHLSSTPLTECATGYQDVVSNQFTIFNVEGIGKMRQEIPRAIASINANPVFDFLVIVVDIDDRNTTDRRTFIEGIIASSTPSLPTNCQVKIIFQQVCIETWFIGHTDHFQTAKACGDSGILSVMSEYDAENNDPELMPNNRPSTINTIGIYHVFFLKQMLKGANRHWKYGKSTADTLIDIPYFQRLEQRLRETPTHLQTFSDMVSFLKSL